MVGEYDDYSRLARASIRAALAVQVVRESDGYQGHLVSPEMGLRRMVDETLGLVLDPVNTAVRRVHQVLINAARCGEQSAAGYACKLKRGPPCRPALANQNSCDCL